MYPSCIKVLILILHYKSVRFNSESRIIFLSVNIYQWIFNSKLTYNFDEQLYYSRQLFDSQFTFASIKTENRALNLKQLFVYFKQIRFLSYDCKQLR